MIYVCVPICCCMQHPSNTCYSCPVPKLIQGIQTWCCSRSSNWRALTCALGLRPGLAFWKWSNMLVRELRWFWGRNKINGSKTKVRWTQQNPPPKTKHDNNSQRSRLFGLKFQTNQSPVLGVWQLKDYLWLFASSSFGNLKCKMLPRKWIFARKWIWFARKWNFCQGNGLLPRSGFSLPGNGLFLPGIWTFTRRWTWVARNLTFCEGYGLFLPRSGLWFARKWFFVVLENEPVLPGNGFWFIWCRAFYWYFSCYAANNNTAKENGTRTTTWRRSQPNRRCGPYLAIQRWWKRPWPGHRWLTRATCSWGAGDTASCSWPGLTRQAWCRQSRHSRSQGTWTQPVARLSYAWKTGWRQCHCCC